MCVLNTHTHTRMHTLTLYNHAVYDRFTAQGSTIVDRIGEVKRCVNTIK